MTRLQTLQQVFLSCELRNAEVAQAAICLFRSTEAAREIRGEYVEKEPETWAHVILTWSLDILGQKSFLYEFSSSDDDKGECFSPVLRVRNKSINRGWWLKKENSQKSLIMKTVDVTPGKKEEIHFMSQDLARKLIVPRKSPKHVKGLINQRKLAELQKTATVTIKEEEDSNKEEKRRMLERLQLILSVKVQAIRDAQIEEKMIRKEYALTESTLDEAMERQMKEGVLKDREIQGKRKERAYEAVTKFQEQIKENEERRLLDEERNIKEGEILLKKLRVEQMKDLNEMKMQQLKKKTILEI